MALTDGRDVTAQYAASDPLRARIRLHALYTEAETPFYRWGFDHVPLSEGTALVEVGCGDGSLWRANRDRLPGRARVVLTDLSPAMLDAARDSFPGAVLLRADAACLPFPDASFDTAVANHMLYHLPDPSRALRELHRVLRPGGVLIASTVGEDNMARFWDMARRAAGDACQAPRPNFTLENGEARLSPYFSHVERFDHAARLFVTDARALADYARSLMALSPEAEAAAEAIAREAESIIAREGGCAIGKSAGLFRAVK